MQTKTLKRSSYLCALASLFLLSCGAPPQEEESISKEDEDISLAIKEQVEERVQQASELEQSAKELRSVIKTQKTVDALEDLSKENGGCTNHYNSYEPKRQPRTNPDP